MSGAWTCASSNEPFLTFGPVTISYESGYGKVPVPEAYKGLSAEQGGTTEMIPGRPAWVHPIPKAYPNTKAEIMVIDNDGVLIRILADATVPVDDLVKVAASLDLENPI